MLIKNVTLENFGLYQGLHKFDLAPRTKYNRPRPIVLFGGNNGAGKTTLLEAIRLALYGRRSMGSRVRQVDYIESLRQRVHRSRSPLLKPRRAAVGLEFDFVMNGVKESFRVERSWVPKTAVDEDLLVLKNGKPLDEVAQEHWQAFIHDIIPEGLSQLFFFDGEKIKEMADDENSVLLADSIKSLLGLDIVERLDSDLAIYASRQIKPTGRSGKSAELSQIVARSNQIAETIIRKREDLANVRTEVKSIALEIARKEEQLRKQGNAFAGNFEDLKSQKEQLEQKISQLEESIRALFDSAFPIAICSGAANTLEKLIDENSGHLHSANIEKAIAEYRSVAVRLIKKKIKSDSDVAVVVKILNETASQFQPKDVPKTSSIELSVSEGAHIRRILSSTSRQDAVKAHVAANDLERGLRTLQKVERDLAQIPHGDVVAPLMEELAQLNRKLGAKRLEQDQLDEEIRKLEHESLGLKRQQNKILEDAASVNGAETRLGLLFKVRESLDDYLAKLTIRKIAELERAVVECFNMLSRKGDLLQSVKIDSKTFSVTLQTKFGEHISRQELSSGEKQLYAVSMLWALAKTSGRPLPVIVDTPLGRLDSEHRLNLITNYFPRASHQVVLLSTDTEIDQGLFKSLSPHISHAYHLVWNKNEGCTTPVEEYFWKDNGND